MFKSINEAHEILMDDRKRADYDFRLKNFYHAKNDFSNQEHIRRKEEEIRRKQEELLRKEQELRQKEFYQESETVRPQESTETDWGKVKNFFLLLNFILILLILVTHESDEAPTVKVTPPHTKKEGTTHIQSNDKNQAIRATTIPDSPDSSAVYATDATQDTLITPEAQSASASPETETSNNDSVFNQSSGQVDTVVKKPKWFQFKKKRELKKKTQKEKDLL